MKKHERNIRVRIKAIYIDKWRFIASKICGKRGGSVLMANAQFLIREMIDTRLLKAA